MNVAVLEAYQGQKIGQQLLIHVLKVLELEKKGQEIIIRIKTGDSSFPAIALYKSCGFKIIEFVKNYFTTHYSESIFENGVLLKHQIIFEKKILG